MSVDLASDLSSEIEQLTASRAVEMIGVIAQSEACDEASLATNYLAISV